MNTWRKFGAFAAFYLAAAHLIGMVIFLAALNYLNLSDPRERLALNLAKQPLIFSTNLLMYVFFGVFLIGLALALGERLKPGAAALSRAAAACGLIWAASLIASGMVANAGLSATAALYATDPAQALLLWQGVEAVANGLGNANGEILGGCWVLLVSLAGLRDGGLPKGLNLLGLGIGAAGILSLLPGLTDALITLFGIGQIVWFVRLGIALSK